MITRVLEWRSKLITWAAAIDGRPFEWGTTDCASLARQALALCFGLDLFPQLAPWTTPYEALRNIRKFGRSSVLLETRGAARYTIPFARTGDIIVMPEHQEPIGREALGVWLDHAVLLSGRERGVHSVVHPILPDDAVAYSLWEIADRG